MLTNNTNIPLPFAVFLAYDDYDYDNDPSVISVTSLIKSTRSIILERRASQMGASSDQDITEFAASSFGTAVHAAVEKPWHNGGYKQAMAAMGHPEKIINAIRINPTKVLPGEIPIYFEQRQKKKIGSWTLSGKYDVVFENKVLDVKTTKAYAYVQQTKVSEFRLQGSMYRWLNPEIILDDNMSIQYYFTDWSAFEHSRQKNYPPANILIQDINLMPLQETESWIKNKLANLDKYMDADEGQLPLCSPAHLWQDPPTIKYYKNPNSTGRSTKNFKDHNDPALNLIDANKRLAEDGYVGKVVKVPQLVKRCSYCRGRALCGQATQLELEGLLKT